MMEKFYKDIEAPLFEVKTCKGWFIQADTIEDALGLANKRGYYKLEDLKQIGYSVAILGTSQKYEDVINMRDQLRRAWELLGHEDAASHIQVVNSRFNFVDDIMPARNEYVLIKTPHCKYPAVVGFWNGVKWLSADDKCEIANVREWISLKNC